MIVLGIESSCDETAAALVRDDGTVLSDVVASQITLHAPYGGVVPELASRDHIRRVLPLTRQVLDEAGAVLADVDVVAFTPLTGQFVSRLRSNGVNVTYRTYPTQLHGLSTAQTLEAVKWANTRTTWPR